MHSLILPLCWGRGSKIPIDSDCPLTWYFQWFSHTIKKLVWDFHREVDWNPFWYSRFTLVKWVEQNYDRWTELLWFPNCEFFMTLTHCFSCLPNFNMKGQLVAFLLSDVSLSLSPWTTWCVRSCQCFFRDLMPWAGPTKHLERHLQLMGWRFTFYHVVDDH